MKNLLEEDLRCYAFFHPSMPNEPLIFVEVALVNGISTDVHELLDEKAPMIDPGKADTAIFYSISNCQDGLAGVSFGNFLIKRVVADLASSLPGLKNFATLSPLPGFTSWLNRQAENVESSDDEEARVSEAAAEVIGTLAAQNNVGDLLNSTAGKSKRAVLARRLQQQLLSLCATYLLKAKRGSQVADRVAHFHLTNGALIKQINWAANLSDNGVEQSLGMMVNYLYDLPSIEKQHEAYRSGEISASAAVKKLVR